MVDCCRARAIAYEKSGRWFTAEEPLLRAEERTDAGSSAFQHPQSELIAPLLQEAAPAFNNRKLHIRLPWCLFSHATGKRDKATFHGNGFAIFDWLPDSSPGSADHPRPVPASRSLQADPPLDRNQSGAAAP